MKNLFAVFFGTLIALVLCVPKTNAQKFGYIDSEFILGKMKEYKEAQGQIDKLTKEWQTEIKGAWDYVDKLKRDFKAEEILLTDLMKKERQDTIKAREESAKNLTDKYFGVNGMHFLKRQELVKPLQDKLFEAIEAVSERKKLAIMFDKSGDLIMLYTDPRHDYTDFVLEELGLGDPKDVIDNPKYKDKD